MSFFYISIKMAGAEGFEPPITGPKPVALPLGHAPNKNVKFKEYFNRDNILKNLCEKRTKKRALLRPILGYEGHTS